MKRDQFEMTLGDLLERRRSRTSGFLWFVAAAAAALIGGLALVAIAGADETDVPSSARREIAMRGNMVEHIDGQARADEGEDLIAQAAQTPADDSHKWHLTVLTRGGCQACQRLKSDLLAGAYRDWVEVEDRQGVLISTPASHMHFHELRYDGDVGRDWARKLERFIKRKIDEFPTLIVQPPITGAFGKHAEIAFMSSGYDGDPEKLTAAMASGLGKYVDSLRRVRMLARRQGDIQQEAGGSPPPFVLAPTNPPETPGLVFPQTIIPPRVAATVEQIKAACPECDAEFLLSQVSKQATLDEAAAAFQQVTLARQIADLKRAQEEAAAKKKAEEEAKQKTPAAVAPATPGVSLTTLIVSVLMALAGGGGIYGLIGLGLKLFRNYRKSTGKPTFLNDEQFAALLAKLEEFAKGMIPVQ